MTSQEIASESKEGWGWGVDWLYTQYMWVWLALLILTIIEVIIPEPQIVGLAFQFPRPFVIVSLILLALVKTWLVAWYYMHLIAERPAIVLIAAAPFLFATFLTVGIFPWVGG